MSSFKAIYFLQKSDPAATDPEHYSYEDIAFEASAGNFYII